MLWKDGGKRFNDPTNDVDFTFTKYLFKKVKVMLIDVFPQFFTVKIDFIRWEISCNNNGYKIHSFSVYFQRAYIIVLLLHIAFDEHKNNTNNSTRIRLSTKPFIKGHGRLALLQ